MKFRFVPGSATQADLEEHPVWAWYEEPGDLEEIRSWGVDLDLARLLEEAFAINRDNIYFPVLGPTPIETGINFKLTHYHATFRFGTSGMRMGYVLPDPSHPYCFQIYPEEENLIFNKHVDRIQEVVAKNRLSARPESR